VSGAGGKAALQAAGSPGSAGDVAVLPGDPSAQSSLRSPSKLPCVRLLSYLSAVPGCCGPRVQTWEEGEWDEKALGNSVRFLLLKVAGITPFLM